MNKYKPNIPSPKVNVKPKSTVRINATPGKSRTGDTAAGTGK
jgi:hypothetical protein